MYTDIVKTAKAVFDSHRFFHTFLSSKRAAASTDAAAFFLYNKKQRQRTAGMVAGQNTDAPPSSITDS
ncbi:MAG TPA: hypothetical protein H9880_10120 [Candidatus Anaerobutyricum avicola]|nr:hypothetical protein [Candidatus Anaerobutyricum avicola]